MSRPIVAAGRGWWFAALLWGLAEATFFFVVPDLLLTFMAQRRGIRAALVGTAFAVLGALLGGLAMWAFALSDAGAARAFVDLVPAISAEMIAAAEPALARDPFGALFAGAFSGIPYKVFAVVGPGAGLSLPAFLAMTVVSRAARFLTVVAVAAILDRLLARWLHVRVRTLILTAAWIIFYAAYWSLTPG